MTEEELHNWADKLARKTLSKENGIYFARDSREIAVSKTKKLLIDIRKEYEQHSKNKR